MGKVKYLSTNNILKFYSTKENTLINIIKYLKNEIINRLRNYFLLKKNLTTKKTTKIYNQSWKVKNNQNWFEKNNNLRLHEYNNKLFLASSGLTQRIWQNEILKRINKINPKTILEVGSGNGINLKILASNYPNKKFVGIDISKVGIEKSNSCKNKVIKKYEYEPLKIISKNKKLDNIKFFCQNAKNLKFKNKSFDLVFTILSLEQMNNIAKKVIKEIKRCTIKDAIFIEPFYNLNKTGLKYLHHHANQYLKLNPNDFIDKDFYKVDFKYNYPNKISLGVGILHIKRNEKK